MSRIKEIYEIVSQYTYASTNLKEFKKWLEANINGKITEFTIKDAEQRFCNLPESIWKEAIEYVKEGTAIDITLLDLEEINNIKENLANNYTENALDSINHFLKKNAISSLDDIFKVKIKEILSDKREETLENRKIILEYFLCKIIGLPQCEEGLNDEDFNLLPLLEPYEIHHFFDKNLQGYRDEYRTIYLAYFNNILTYYKVENDIIENRIEIEDLSVIYTHNKFLAQHFKDGLNKNEKIKNIELKKLFSFLADTNHNEIYKFVIDNFLIANKINDNFKCNFEIDKILQTIIMLSFYYKINFNPNRLLEFASNLPQEQKTIFEILYLVCYQRHDILEFFNIKNYVSKDENLSSVFVSFNNIDKTQIEEIFKFAKIGTDIEGNIFSFHLNQNQFFINLKKLHSLIVKKIKPIKDIERIVKEDENQNLLLKENEEETIIELPEDNKIRSMIENDRSTLKKESIKITLLVYFLCVALPLGICIGSSYGADITITHNKNVGTFFLILIAGVSATLTLFCSIYLPFFIVDICRNGRLRTVSLNEEHMLHNTDILRDELTVYKILSKTEQEIPEIYKEMVYDNSFLDKVVNTINRNSPDEISL